MSSGWSSGWPSGGFSRSSSGMSVGSTGSGLLHRLRAERIDVVELREVADQVLPDLATVGLRITVREHAFAGSSVVVTEEERQLTARLADLADGMTAAGVPATPEAMASALAGWVARRPVPDAAAAGQGVAVLDWSDEQHSAVGWRVVVRRGEVVVPWAPSVAVDDGGLRRTRDAAVARAAQLPLDLRVEGSVALWTHPLPALATAVLAAPERMLAGLADAGLGTGDPHVVVTPHRPVACAAAGVAARLAGQTAEDRLVMPWRELGDLPWL